MNANAKWELQSEKCLTDLGLRQVQQIPQLFHRQENTKSLLIVTKLFDDIKAAGIGENAKKFIESFDESFNLETVSNGPSQLRFFDTNTVQDEYLTVLTKSDEQLNALAK